MFSKFFIERPRFAIVISVIMVLAGIVSLFKLPVAEYPEIAPPTLFVSTCYTGASADVVADTVAMVLEDEINGVDDLLYYSSQSDNNGNYFCKVTFKSGTDTDIAMVNLQNAVKKAEPKLPSEVKQVGVAVEKRGNDILAMFTFMTDNRTLDVMQLHNYVDSNVKDALARIDGVSSAELLSQKEYSMRIWLDPLRMSGLKISTADITNAVQSQNIQAAAGFIGSENSNRYVNYKLNVHGRLKKASEFENIVIRRDPDGSVITLKDIGKVEVGTSTYAGQSYYNGKEVVGLLIYRTPDANALATVNRVKAELAQWQKRFPAGVSFDTAYDPTEFIDVTMKEIAVTIVIALLLVVLITWLFLQDWRATLIPSIAIPIALIGTFPFMYFYDYSINVLTMFGLILVIGSLCDDAIAVTENCQSILERENITPKEAAIKSMKQITGAIIATTLVTIACYMPLAFYGGMVGNIYVQFAVTMCISLSLSTIVAMTLSPVLCAYLLRKPDGHVPVFFRPFNAVMDRSRSVYLFFVKLLVRQGIITVILFGAMLAVTCWLYKTTRTSFLPPEDKGVIFCNIELPRSASQERTIEVLHEFRRSIRDLKGIRSDVVVAGFSMMSGNGENAGMAILQLDHWDKRTTPETSLNHLIAEIQKRTRHIAAANIICFTPPAIMGLGITGGVTFELCGIGEINPQDLDRVTKQVTFGLMADKEHVLYAMSSYNADTPQLFLDVDRRKAESLGIPASSIFSALQSNFASIYVNDFNMEGGNYKVKIQSSTGFRSSLRNIEEIQIPSVRGEMVPLTAFSTLRYTVGPNQIMRFNKMTCAEINAAAKPGVSSGEMMKLVEKLKLPKNYHIEWTGLSFQERQNEGQILFLMALALVFAYLFLVAQYESWTIPLPCMLTVATACLGALIGLRITGETLSIYAQLGMVMLIGLTAKNAILMVEFSKQAREEGLNVYDAAVAGANLRYRAVLMTAWSFLFGVFPLVIASGAGSGSRQAIGITTFSGMLLATIVGIVFTPALYAVCQRLREWFKAKLRWEQRFKN